VVRGKEGRGCLPGRKRAFLSPEGLGAGCLLLAGACADSHQVWGSINLGEAELVRVLSGRSSDKSLSTSLVWALWPKSLEHKGKRPHPKGRVLPLSLLRDPQSSSIQVFPVSESKLLHWNLERLGLKDPLLTVVFSGTSRERVAWGPVLGTKPVSVFCQNFPLATRLTSAKDTTKLQTRPPEGLGKPSLELGGWAVLAFVIPMVNGNCKLLPG
jgi:hypothetical protein